MLKVAPGDLTRPRADSVGEIFWKLTTGRFPMPSYEDQFGSRQPGSLTRGEGIGLRARDGIFGVPLRGLLARVLDAQGAAVFTGSVSLDGEGRGEIPSLRPGRYTLVVESRPKAFTIQEGATRVPGPPVTAAVARPQQRQRY